MVRTAPSNQKYGKETWQAGTGCSESQDFHYSKFLSSGLWSKATRVKQKTNKIIGWG